MIGAVIELCEWVVKVSILIGWLMIVLGVWFVYVIVYCVCALTHKRRPRFPRGLRRPPVRL